MGKQFTEINITEDIAGDFRVDKEALKHVNDRINDLERLATLLNEAEIEADKNNNIELLEEIREEKEAINEALADLSDIKDQILAGDFQYPDEDPFNGKTSMGKSETDGPESEENPIQVAATGKDKETTENGIHGDNYNPEGSSTGSDKEPTEDNPDNQKPGQSRNKSQEEEKPNYIPRPKAFDDETEPTGNGGNPTENGTETTQQTNGTKETTNKSGEEESETPSKQNSQSNDTSDTTTEGDNGDGDGGSTADSTDDIDPQEGQNQESQAQEEPNPEESQNNQTQSSNNKQSNTTNPFIPTPDNQIKGQGKMTPEEIINYLNSLPDEARKAAVDGLKNVLADKENTNESFDLAKKTNLVEEKLNDIFDWTDTKFNTYYNRVSDLVNKALAGKGILIQDPTANISKVKSMFDPIEMQELTQEITADSAAEQKKRAALDSEKQKFGKYEPISNFWVSFNRAINDQIQKYMEDQRSWLAFNNAADENGIIDKGTRKIEADKIDKPTIDFFFDMSGSWTDDKKAIALGNRIYKTFIDEEKAGNIVLRPWYFSNIITDNIDDPNLGGGTHAWSKIIEKIKKYNAKNIVIITDTDMPDLANLGYESMGSGIKVPGEVWFIYREDGRSNAAKLLAEFPRHLQGKLGTSEYMFNSRELNI